MGLLAVADFSEHVSWRVFMVILNYQESRNKQNEQPKSVLVNIGQERTQSDSFSANHGLVILFPMVQLFGL